MKKNILRSLFNKYGGTLGTNGSLSFLFDTKGVFTISKSAVKTKDIEQLEDHKPLSKTTDAIDFQLDKYHLKRLKELGLSDEGDSDNPYDLDSYK